VITCFLLACTAPTLNAFWIGLIIHVSDAAVKARSGKPKIAIQSKVIKLAPWHECGKCEGKGKVHSAEYEPIVESELATTEEATKVYEKFLEKFNSVMEKIEPEDVEFLLENVKIVPNPK